MIKQSLLPLLLTCATAQALTWRVPGDLPTIPLAIQASQDGDTILVAAGVHAGPVDFMGRQARLASESGPALTTITCPVGPIVRFVSGEGPGAELEGFTLSGGVTSEAEGSCGGAIRVVDASPLIRGNLIRDNLAVLGGGVCLLAGGARLEGNTFLGNEAEEGGAVFAQGGAPQLEGNHLQGNLAAGAGYGGALALEACAAQVRLNRFVGNLARLGGAWSCRGAAAQEALFESNSLARNEADFGGGAYFLDCAPLLRTTVLAHATAGSGLWCNNAQPRLECCDLYGNAGGDALCGEDLGGNLNADPLYCDLEAGDLRLSAGSPCWSTACGVIGAWSVDCDGADLPPPPTRPSKASLKLMLWPNPANPLTWLQLELPRPGPLRLELFNLRGALLGSHERWAAAGMLEIPLSGLGVDPARLPGGLYFLRATTPDTSGTTRLLLLP